MCAIENISSSHSQVLELVASSNPPGLHEHYLNLILKEVVALWWRGLTALLSQWGYSAVILKQYRCEGAFSRASCVWCQQVKDMQNPNNGEQTYCQDRDFPVSIWVEIFFKKMKGAKGVGIASHAEN
eukprot:1139460-Pelagomonas_calceolata.AAC.1